MFESVLVANRGEIARRVIRTVQRLGLRAVAVHSDVDADLPFVAEADEAILLGPAPPAESYRNVAAVLEAARVSGAQAVHPGYGFLSENAGFARAVVDAGLVWIGPPPAAIERMGDKIVARNVAEEAGMPVSRGTREPVESVDGALAAAASLGYPLMVKASAGGGGMGMAVAADSEELRIQYEKVGSFAARMFGDPTVLLERYFPSVRHVEIQVLGLADGSVVALGERDCSVQRRHQKVVEESPSPALDASLRARMEEAATRVAAAVGYRGAGTVECLLDTATGEFVFLEMNTRLQVEHPVTELVYGIDLVEAQLLIAAGEPVSFDPVGLAPHGHAVELRVNAEDPKRFLPGPGVITRWEEPAGTGVRVDAGYRAGNTVTPSYDSLLAKVITYGRDRAEAISRARTAVGQFVIEGPKNNVAFLVEVLDSEEFTSGRYDTGIVGRLRP